MQLSFNTKRNPIESLRTLTDLNFQDGYKKSNLPPNQLRLKHPYSEKK